MKGRSFLPVLSGKKPAARPEFYCEYCEERQFPRIPGWHAVRSPEWKYIEYKEHPEWTELYHLRADPFEMKNRIGDPAAQSVRGRLAGGLKALPRDLPD